MAALEQWGCNSSQDHQLADVNVNVAINGRRVVSSLTVFEMLQAALGW